MKRRITILAAFAVLALGGAFGAARLNPAPDRVYTVAQLFPTIMYRPATWGGRTLRVRGYISGGCAPASCNYILSDTRFGAISNSIIIAPGPPDPLLSALRRLPLVSQFAPSPQPLSSDGPRIFRIRTLPEPPCPTPPCANPNLSPDALLLDAAPSPSSRATTPVLRVMPVRGTPVSAPVRTR